MSSSVVSGVSESGITRRTCATVAPPLIEHEARQYAGKSSERARVTPPPRASFWSDLTTGRWMLEPTSSFKLLLITAIYYLGHSLLVFAGAISSTAPNYARPFLFLSGQQEDGRYTKEWADALFVAHQVIFCSCVRQFSTIHIFRPLAIWLEVRKSKQVRFTEQAYALCYWGVMGISGIIVMSGLPSWYFKTEAFYHGYPHKLMPYGVKSLYLLQASYWLQQSILLAAQIERPRRDYKLFILHLIVQHTVTLYLIIGSYILYFSHKGIAVFATMDCSEIPFALAKCINYYDETASKPVFLAFVLIWIYCRHYLNFRILWSIWNEWNLIPEGQCNLWAPSQDKFCAPWLRLQIFIPMMLIQLMNLFWLCLIIRTLYRAVYNVPLKDDRSDDEGEEGEEGEKGEEEGESDREDEEDEEEGTVEVAVEGIRLKAL